MRSVASPPSSTTSCGPLPPGWQSALYVHHQYSSSVSPFQAKTGTLAAAMAAAAWSCVEKMLQLAHGLLQCGGFVGFFPGDAFGVIDFAEVAVVGGLRINRTEQVELLDDGGRLEAEDLLDGFGDRFIADFAAAESVDGN